MAILKLSKRGISRSSSDRLLGRSNRDDRPLWLESDAILDKLALFLSFYTLQPVYPDRWAGLEPGNGRNLSARSIANTHIRANQCPNRQSYPQGHWYSGNQHTGSYINHHSDPPSNLDAEHPMKATQFQYQGERSHIALWMVILWIFLVSITGCQVKKVIQTEPITSQPAPEKTDDHTTYAELLTIQQELPVEPTPIGKSDPLRFNLPTPGPAPISLWRPPLYDTPWALGPFDHFYFSRPIAADEVNWPVADYRYGGVFFGSDIIHTGIDIPSPTGTPVLAAADGRVIWAGYGLYYGNNDPKDPYGLAVTIRHDFGYAGQRLYTVYAHMDQILVKDGQEVKTGDVLGLVGTTGLTTGPHLHLKYEWSVTVTLPLSTLNYGWPPSRLGSPGGIITKHKWFPAHRS